MLRAFAVKGVALVVAIVALWLLPAKWELIAILAVIAGTIGFHVYAIVSPKSQFFASAVNRLAAGQPIVALTFDDGPDPVFTPRILDVLDAHDARATFFVLGDRAGRHPELIQRIHDRGHTVGTHTQNHRVRFHFGSPSYVRREIEDAVNVVARILRVRPTLFRPPQGLRTPFFSTAWRRISGLRCVLWSIRGFDSRPTTAEAITERVVKRLEPGAIVALHDGTGLLGGHDREPTIAALDAILTECKARGLRCVALGERGVC